MSSNQSLRKLSDNALLSQLHKLVAHEKQTTLSILVHLAEVDRRDLYLGYGFSSLFDYCVGALGYSRSAAGRRIASARCLRRYPEVFDLLESGDVNLCTVGLVAPILDDANKDLLFREIRGKTQQQVESIVSRYKPPTAYRDRVRPVRVAVPSLGQNSNNRRNPLIFNSRCGSGDQRNCGIVDPSGHEGASAGNAGGSQGSSPTLSGGDGTKGACHASGAASDNERSDGGNGRDNRHNGVRIEQRLLIQFLADEAFMVKLGKVKSLLSNKIPGGSFEEVFGVLIDEFIDRHSPEKRDERRAKRRSTKLEKKGADREAKENHVDSVRTHARRGWRRWGPRSGAASASTRGLTLQVIDASVRNTPHSASLRVIGDRTRAVLGEQSDEAASRAVLGEQSDEAASRAALGEQSDEAATGNNIRSRYIPAGIRDAVFKRDGGTCTYRGKSGKRCGSTHNLQIDHIKPFARGGENTLTNLRLLCGKHNRHEATRILGADVMSRYARRE